MSRLVSDLLLLARADAGRRSARTHADLAEVARTAVAEVAHLAERHALHSGVSKEAIPVEGNPDELHRLALNLLENAVRHTPPGSTIELYAGRDGDEALLEVSDDGPGIPREIRDQVFERFVRGEGPADTAARGGSGLGLAIVRAVAASHGGTVEAGESDRGGARLKVRIPLLRIDSPDVVSGADEITPAGAALPRPPRASSEPPAGR
jgi:signal transduction histidine kinase